MVQEDRVPVGAVLSDLRDALKGYGSTLRDFYDAGSVSRGQVTDSAQRVIVAYLAAEKALTRTQLALIDPWFARTAADFSRLRQIAAFAQQIVQRESGAKQRFGAAAMAAAAAFVALPAAIAERVRKDAIVGVALPKQLELFRRYQRRSRLWLFITLIGLGLSFVPGPQWLGIVTALVGLGLFLLEKTLMGRYLHPGAGLTGLEAAQAATATEALAERLKKVDAVCKDLKELRLEWPEPISRTVEDLHSSQQVAPDTLAEQTAKAIAIAARLSPFALAVMETPQGGS